MIIGIPVLSFILWILGAIMAESPLYYQEIDKNLVNTYVHRTIDINSPLVKVNVTIRMQNYGKTSVFGFLYAIKKKYNKHLSYIAAYTKTGQRLKFKDTNVQYLKSSSFKYITLKESLLPQGITQVNIEAIFSHRIVPLHKYEKELDNQFLQFVDNHYFFTPYPTLYQKTFVVFGSGRVKTVTEKEPTFQYGNMYKFGPYFNITAFKSNAMVLHIENHKVFLTITKLSREVFVSHWGQIQVKDSIDINNEGSSFINHKLTGKKYLRRQYFITSILPSTAKNIEVNDMFGHVDSKVKHHSAYTEVMVTPHVPQGETRTSYNLSYFIPIENFLFFTENYYVLKMKLLDIFFQNMCIDQAEIKIILPEGASEIIFYVPYETFRLPDRATYLFLDIFGHPTISLIKANMIDKHVVDFELLYNYEPIYFLYKPVLIVLGFFIFFILFLMCCRQCDVADTDKED